MSAVVAVSNIFWFNRDEQVFGYGPYIAKNVVLSGKISDGSAFGAVVRALTECV